MCIPMKNIESTLYIPMKNIESTLYITTHYFRTTVGEIFFFSDKGNTDETPQGNLILLMHYMVI